MPPQGFILAQCLPAFCPPITNAATRFYFGTVFTGILPTDCLILKLIGWNFAHLCISIFRTAFKQELGDKKNNAQSNTWYGLSYLKHTLCAG